MEQVSYRILVVEDDLHMMALLRQGLRERGHSVVSAVNAQEGAELSRSQQFDTVILDIGLPDRSGITVAKEIRQRSDRPAVIMLTALREEDHIVHGLDSGADDYITKPFSFEELQARILSVGRRNRFRQSSEIQFSVFTLDLQKHRLMARYKDLHLTRSEYMALRELALHLGETVARRQLMLAVWGTTEINQGSLDTLMATLREKLHAVERDVLFTRKGLGYTLRHNMPLSETLC
jgi:DNA-binding response OmpR family regulator